MKMKAKLDAFLSTATHEDISALLDRTNYEFYKNVSVPIDDWFDIDMVETEQITLEIPVMAASHQRGVPNRPVVYIGRGCQAADHQDLALAA